MGSFWGPDLRGHLISAHILGSIWGSIVRDPFGVDLRTYCVGPNLGAFCGPILGGPILGFNLVAPKKAHNLDAKMDPPEGSKA